MAVNPANMEDCAPKARCINGPNEGVAYDRDSPCGGAANVAFNPVTCDCEATVLCSDGDCGYDITWSRPDLTPYSLTLCGASTCTIVCDNEPQYRACSGVSPGATGSFYLAPGKCLRKVVEGVPNPCLNDYDSGAPSGAFRSQYWYACNPDVADPSYATCSTPILQFPANGYCFGVWSGGDIAETGRVQRVKLATSTRFEWQQATGGEATCVDCSPPDSLFATTSNLGWRAPVEEDSYSTVTFSSVSAACGGSGSCPSTWRGYTGTDWVMVGTSVYNADETTPPCAVSDGLAVVATAGISLNGIAKGETIAHVVAYGTTGAVGCTHEGSHVPGAITTTSYNCYKPSDLV